MNQGKHMTDDEIIEANCRQNFAAARGARIQIFVAETRIHPDDEHLQYGPVSTALREFAETGAEPYTLTGLMARGAYVYECEYRTAEWPQAQMFALILAEALADEGM